MLAVRGPDERTMKRLLELVPMVRDRVGLNVAVSAGILDDDKAQRLAAGGRAPLQPQPRDSAVVLPADRHHPHVGRAVRDVRARSPSRHGAVLRRAARHGRDRSTQRVELIGQLRSVEPAEVPINFLNPRPGTPLGDRALVEPLEALRWIALFRLGLPSVILRYAGGREVTLRELQAMGMTAGINALIVGNYLTTLGRSPEDDLQMLDDLHMPIGVLSKVI